jgi:SAM-dependent methyltransferase
MTAGSPWLDKHYPEQETDIADRLAGRLEIADFDANHEFRSLARRLGRNPDNLWIGGYAERTWTSVRYFIAGYAADVSGKRVLEFGCNIGASAIVFSRLGAAVDAVDIDETIVDLARLNAARYGASNISFAVLTPPPATSLPFEDEIFDIVSCNSVLECLRPLTLLGPVLAELNRVLRPGGLMLIAGTSNRLAPREVHSRRWMVNYVPGWIDRMIGPLPRGISPWRVRQYLGSGYEDQVHRDPRSYLAAQRFSGASSVKLSFLAMALPVCHAAGWSVGMLTPSFFLAMRKKDQPRARREYRGEQ